MARVVRPGGRFVLACHAGDDPLPSWADPDVYRIPTTDRLREMLEAAGLTRIDVMCDDKSGWPTYWFVADLSIADT